MAPLDPTPASPHPGPIDLAMMTRALELADAAAAIGEVPVGAVVYRVEQDAPEILGEGFNTRERDADPSAHAEFKAILAAARAIGDWRLEGCSLAVTLEPCPMCAGLIINSRVARVLYGADDPKAGAVRSLFSLLNDSRLNHRPEVIPGVLAQPAGEKLREFFRGLRQK
jgi:tRNA(adenine34) deaminase